MMHLEAYAQDALSADKPPTRAGRRFFQVFQVFQVFQFFSDVSSITALLSSLRWRIIACGRRAETGVNHVSR